MAQHPLSERTTSTSGSSRRNEPALTDLLERYGTTRDPHLRQEIVVRHRRLAEIVAEDYVRRGVERDDLRQIALVGLVKAIDRFDPSVGTPFATFASITMNGEIKRYFRDASWDVRPPRRLQQMSQQVRQASDELSHELGRSPSVREVADHLDVSSDQVLEGFAASTAYRADRLDRPVFDQTSGATRAVERLAEDDVGFERRDQSDVAEGLLDALSDRDAEVVRLRFWEDLTQSEIAERTGISQCHVSRVLRTSLQRMRDKASFSGDLAV